MKALWNYVHNLDATLERKSAIFLSVLCILCGGAGFFVWFVLHFFVLDSFIWAFCFTGWPAVLFGILGGTLYLFAHRP